MKVNYTTRQSISISILFMLLVTSCTYFKNKKAEKKMQEFSEYKDLHDHQGSINYEIVALCNQNSETSIKFFDKIQKALYVSGSDKITKNAFIKKSNFFGSDIRENQIESILKDGTLFDDEYYSYWFLNDDTTKYKHIDPFTNKVINNLYRFKNSETDFKKWFEKFKEFYNKATYVKRDGSSYYLKIDEKWYYMELKFDKRPKDFVDQFPAKIDPEEIRMVEFTESMEDLMKAGVIEVVDYVEMDSESGLGLNPINFSSGYYMLELHLPDGDVLKFRRYGAMGVSSELFVYQIPKELGGSDDVFFIEQAPNRLYPDKSHAGFYCIRPKDYKASTTYKKLYGHLDEQKKQEQIKKRYDFLGEYK